MESRNIDIVKRVIKILGEKNDRIAFVKDQPGHDWRYFLDSSRIQKLGWKPKNNIEQGLAKTACWYKDNYQWLKAKVKSVKKHWDRVYIYS